MDCKYEWLFDESSKKCEVNDVDLSNIFREENFEISGSAEKLNETTVIEFGLNPNVDFIPPAVVDKFPNLIHLGVISSNVPIIKNDLFSSKFFKIKGLYILFSETEFIEENAFGHLKNLEEIDLHSNRIQSLGGALFSNNPKLKSIDFAFNRIKIINPKLFTNLNHLKEVDFAKNECIYASFGCHDCTAIDHEELNRELSQCYSNCFVDRECGKDLRHVPKNFQAILIQIYAKNWIFKVLDSQVSIYQKKGPSLGSSKRTILSFQEKCCPSYEHRKRTISNHIEN